MNETGKDLGLTPRKMEIGETIKFDDVIQNQVISEYGEVTLNLFFQNGTAVRKVFSNALAKHLAKNPKSNSVTLVKKLKDGDSQYNIYE
jgi:hypothetical protein